MVNRFYAEHLGALKDSAWEIEITQKMAPVSRQKITYLDNGVAAWLKKEKEIQVRFEHYVDTKGKIGAVMGQIHELQQYKAGNPSLEAHYTMLNQHEAHLNNIAGILNDGLRQIGYKTRMFSAISSPAYQTYLQNATKPPLDSLTYTVQQYNNTSQTVHPVDTLNQNQPGASRTSESLWNNYSNVQDHIPVQPDFKN